MSVESGVPSVGDSAMEVHDMASPHAFRQALPKPLAEDVEIGRTVLNADHGGARKGIDDASTFPVHAMRHADSWVRKVGVDAHALLGPRAWRRARDPRAGCVMRLCPAFMERFPCVDRSSHHAQSRARSTPRSRDLAWNLLGSLPLDSTGGHSSACERVRGWGSKPPGPRGRVAGGLPRGGTAALAPGPRCAAACWHRARC